VARSLKAPLFRAGDSAHPGLAAAFFRLADLRAGMSTEPTEPQDRPTVVATRSELDEILAANDRVLVMVRTTGCTICKSMEPILDNVARATDAAVAVFNPKDDLDAVEAFNVRSVPTYLLFEDGEQRDRRDDGFVPTAELVEFVERAD